MCGHWIFREKKMKCDQSGDVIIFDEIEFAGG